MGKIYVLVFPTSYKDSIKIMNLEEFFKILLDFGYDDCNEDYKPFEFKRIGEIYDKEPVFSMDKEILIKYAENYIELLKEKGDYLLEMVENTKIVDETHKNDI